MLREVRPWLEENDRIVAYSGHWLVYFWLFSLLAFEPLNGVPGPPERVRWRERAD